MELEVFEKQDPDSPDGEARWSPVSRHHGLQMINSDALGCLFDVLKEGHEAVLRPVLTEHRDLAMELCDFSRVLGRRAAAVASKSNARILNELGKALPPMPGERGSRACFTNTTPRSGSAPHFAPCGLEQWRRTRMQRW